MQSGPHTTPTRKVNGAKMYMCIRMVSRTPHLDYPRRAHDQAAASASREWLGHKYVPCNVYNVTVQRLQTYVLYVCTILSELPCSSGLRVLDPSLTCLLALGPSEFTVVYQALMYVHAYTNDHYPFSLLINYSVPVASASDRPGARS